MGYREALKPDFDVIGAPIALVWGRGKGCIIADTKDKEYIDICNHHQCVDLGYGRKDVHNAIMEQLSKLEYATVLPPSTNEIVGRCGEKLVTVLCAGLGHLFFTTGGTEMAVISIF